MLINRLDLLRCMQTVIKVVQQKGAIPTLSGVSLTAQNNLLQVRGTDLETGMEAQSVCQGDLKTVLPAKMLLDIVSKLSNDTVEINVQEGTAEIKCGRSHYTISAMDFENYPIFPELNVPRWEMDAKKPDLEQEKHRVLITLPDKRPIDHKVWERWKKKFGEKYPKAVANINKKVNKSKKEEVENV